VLFSTDRGILRGMDLSSRTSLTDVRTKLQGEITELVQQRLLPGAQEGLNKELEAKHRMLHLVEATEQLPLACQEQAGVQACGTEQLSGDARGR
jgi:hypothetical protein